MSTFSGIGGKGDKGSNKYKSLNINNIYQGKSVPTQKSTVTRQHGLQSLGKVASMRRMPPPANLPSLKSENSGNDPNINLVPTGGSGWGTKEKEQEKTTAPSGQPPSTQPSQATAVSSAQSTTKTTVAGGSAAVTSAAAAPSGTSSAPKSWSSVALGERGKPLGHHSPYQEEFPTLKSAGEDKGKDGKKEEEGKDTQYGPGPSLRPQNVASWREGGGRGAMQQQQNKPDSPSSPTGSTSQGQTETQQNGPPTSGPTEVPSQPPRPGSGPTPGGPMPMGPPMGMPPQYRMMPPYMYGRFPPGYPPNYQGMPRPPYPYDQRFRHPPPMPAQQRPPVGGDGEEYKRAAIISEKDLKDFDNLRLDHEDEGWAGAQGEIDYSEKLVFSDEEDDDKESGKSRHRRSEKRERKDDMNDEDDGGKGERGYPMPREAWGGGPIPPQYRGRPPMGMDGRWQIPPFDYMGPPPRGPHYPQYRVPPPGQRPPGPYPHPQMTPPQPPQSPQSPGPSLSPSQTPKKSEAKDELEEEQWKEKRMQRTEEMSTAIQRARQRREDEEKKIESERKAAAAEKLRQLDERSKKRDDRDAESDSRSEGRSDGGRSSRTPSESSEKDFKTHKEQQTSKVSSRGAVPPRFQKQHSSEHPPTSVRQTGQGTPTSPQPHPTQMRPGQGPPPPWFWHPSMQMPPYAFGRPPVDMQGMPMYPPMRRRNDSHGSGNDGQDGEGRPDGYERGDPRQFYPHMPPHLAQFDGRGPPPYFDQRMYPDYEKQLMEYERRQDRDQDRRDKDHRSDHSYEEELEHETREPEKRAPRLQKDPFDDTPDDRYTPSPKDSKKENKVVDKKEEKQSKEDLRDRMDLYDDRKDRRDDKGDDRRNDYTRKDRDHDSQKSYRNKESRSSKAPWYTDDGSRSYREKREYPNCPPPIPAQQSQQNLPPRPNYTTLKRPLSNSNDRKADYLKEQSETKPKSLSKDQHRDSKSGKENKTAERDDKQKQRDDHQKDLDRSGNEDASKDKQQSKAKDDRREKEDSVGREERPSAWDKPMRDEGKGEKRSDRNQPPLKKKREEYNQDKGDRRQPSSRAREFVRGRGGKVTRGSKPSNPPGRGGRGGNRESYPRSYDRRGGERSGYRTDRSKSFGGQWSDHVDDLELEEEMQRRREKAEEVDFDGKEGSRSPEEYGDQSNFGKGKDQKDRRVSQEQQETKPFSWENRAKSLELKKGDSFEKQKQLSDDRKSDESHMTRKSSDEKWESRNGRGTFQPRGEPSKRGRGGSSSMRGRGRGSLKEMGERGERRNYSAPSRGGGFGRPGQREGGELSEKGPPRKDNRRQERFPPPPRFAQKRGGLNERGRGAERGRGRGRGRGGSAPPTTALPVNKRPQLKKENSQEYPEGEEWETASESSDVLDRKESKNEVKDKDKRDSTGKKFSSQRPQNDRQARKGSQNSDWKTNGEVYQGRGNGKDTGSKNGVSRGHQRDGPRKSSGSSKRDNNVYRVGEVVPDDPNAIQSAINNSLDQKNLYGRKADLSEVSKPVKVEEKKNALANIDINNYASVVVIDEVPEVTNDDPAFLFEQNDGFQEVTSKRTIRSKQKAQQEIELMKQKEQTKKSVSKVVVKPKSVHVKVSLEKPRYKTSKLPPRLAKKKEQMEKERKEAKGFELKIENWDNELANNIPTHSDNMVISSEPKGMMNMMSQVSTTQIPSSMTIQSSSIGPLVNAPIPVASAWGTKPAISYAAATGSVDKPENHDSGVDAIHQEDDKLANNSKSSFGSPKPQRQPKITRSEKVSVKDTMDKPDGMKTIKKPDLMKEKSRNASAIEKPEPIQLPPSFNKVPMDESNEIKLDFIYDDDLATSFPDKTGQKANTVEEGSPVTVSLSGGSGSDHNAGPASPAAQDLNSKIAAVKTFWDSDQTNVFDVISSSAGLGNTVPTTEADLANASSSFHSFSSDTNLAGPEHGSGIVLDSVVMSADDGSRGGSKNLSPRIQEALSTFSSSSMDATMDSKNAEQTNVCKVKPQQLQSPLEPDSLSNSAGSGGMLGVPVEDPNSSLQSMLTSQHPFQSFPIGTSQILQQEPRLSQSNYGYGLSQQPPPMGQQSLFMTPSQDSFPMPQMSAYTNRNQPQQQQQHAQFGQTPPQQNTIMVSSATSSLMSTAIKPPNQNTAYGALQKNMAAGSLQFGQQMNSTSLQPSQMSFIQYDPSTLFGNLTQPTQNVNSSQILNSHVVQQRVQPHQGTSSFYQQSQQPMQQSFFSSQAQSNSIQPMGNGNRKTGGEQLMFQACILSGALQQAAAAGPQFSMQTFGNQTNNPVATGLNLSLQPSNPAVAQQALGLGPQTNVSKVSQFSHPLQQPSQTPVSPQSTPMKSPPQSTNFGVSSSVPQSQGGSKFFGTNQLQNRAGTQRYTFGNSNVHNSINAPPFNPKMNTPYGQHIQSGASVVRPQMLLNTGNFRPNVPPSQGSFPNPIQRPGGQVAGNPRPPRPQGKPPGPPPPSQDNSSKTGSAFKAQQAKERQGLLAHAQSFLNPQNKPSIKNMPPKVETSTVEKKGSPSPNGGVTDEKPPKPATEGTNSGEKSQ
ncbi:protein PRRC2C-like isoform X5 [Ostrea edulis]|uniref:protein PRRC2C-like isoform X5 n=1 Tax=Ostrea edulis TaxID=37623 RepID=UPI0024AED970|nr:protein PRRC2C-like isoform X5 [Ostrea edulis]